jgi:hypothetical protein
MGLKVYLPLAVVVSLAATTGADLIARTAIGGERFASALREHLYFAAVQFVGTVFLLAPFVAVALISTLIEKRARRRTVAPIFGAAMLTLFYFFLEGYQGAQHALLQKRWTAAALSIGLLPFFPGVAVVIGVVGAGALAARFDRRTSVPPVARSSGRLWTGDE